MMMIVRVVVKERRAGSDCSPLSMGQVVVLYGDMLWMFMYTLPDIDKPLTNPLPCLVHDSGETDAIASPLERVWRMHLIANDAG